MSEKLRKKATYKLKGGKTVKDRKMQFITLLRESLFNVAWACNQIGMDRRSYTRWRQEDPEFDIACTDIQEEILDEAEVYLQKKIRENDTASLIFFLKTKAKQRGYVERQELEHSGSSIATFNIIEKSVEEIKSERNNTDSEPQADGNTANP